MGKSPAQANEDGITILDSFSHRRERKGRRDSMFKLHKIKRIRRLVNDLVE
jgi:hypothetical protein